MNQIELPADAESATAPTTKTYAQRAADFNALRTLNQLEALLHRGPGRQARRQFERLFAKHWPNIDPNPQQHPRLAIVVASYRKRVEDLTALSAGGKTAALTAKLAG